MTAQQEAPMAARRRRPPFGILLLAAIPLAIAGIGGITAANVADAPAPATSTAPLAIPVEGAAEEVAAIEVSSDVLAAVVAPAIDADTADAVPQIAISFEPEPEPEPVPAPQRAGASSSSGASGAAQSGQGSQSGQGAKSTEGSNSSGSGSSQARKPAPQQSADSYCAAPASPYAAGGSVKGLLTAANKERARIGVGPMSWSGSLASAASGWSQTLAGRDTAGNGSALAHNPNRPGGENVAVSGSAAGMSVSAAINKAHVGWMYSGGHCRNVMNPGYSSMGAGSAATANGNAVYTTANYR